MPKETLCVAVPYEADLSYTLFSEGASLKEPSIDEDSMYITFCYVPESVTVLFYTFAEFRRVYVVTEWNGLTEKVFLPGVKSPVSVIFAARGKKFDNLKRAIYLLKEKYGYGIFLERILFWQKLTGMCRKTLSKNLLFYFYENWRNGKWNLRQA